MPNNVGAIKIIQGFVTGSQDSSMNGSFAKELKDFLETASALSSSGIVEDISYVQSHHKYMTAIITLSGSLPA